jgi:TetR/AcrR family transcriptional regulator, repressor for uid operon
MGTMETAQAIVNEANQEAQPESGAAPRSVDWENPRVEAILTAAAKCFARRGFNATTLAEIGKELGLRKSIVHYYFASKAALVQEVQSFSYQRVIAGIRAALNTATSRSLDESLRSLWGPLHGDGTTKGLNIEIWSAIRRDPEMRRRATVLQNDARQLLVERFASQVSDPEAFATLTLAVLDGLAVTDSITGDKAQTRAAFDVFVSLAGASRAEARSSAA